MEWISVKDRLPEDSGYYLSYGFDENNNRKHKLSFFLGGNSGFVREEYCNSITHWMPLPEPPEDMEQKLVRLKTVDDIPNRLFKIK